MQYSWLPQKERQPLMRLHPRRPIVISEQRLACLLDRASQAKNQTQYLLYKKDFIPTGTTDVVQSNGPNGQSSSNGNGVEQGLRNSAPQTKSSTIVCFEDQSSSSRTQRIAKSQLLLEQLRPGPLELHCAQLQSEIMRAVSAQRQLQNDFARAARKQRVYDCRLYEEQVMFGLEQAQQNIVQRRQQSNQHRLQLHQMIENKKKEREDTRAAELQEANSRRELEQRELQAYRDREHHKEANKMHQLREEELAAIAMTKQISQRSKMLAEVQEMQCDVHNVTKCDVQTLKKIQMRQRYSQQQSNAAIIPRLQYDVSTDRADRHERISEELQRAHSSRQRAYRKRLDAANAERIASQSLELNAAIAAIQRDEGQQRSDIALRLQNEQVNHMFEEVTRRTKLQAIQSLRRELTKQVQARAEEEARPRSDYNRRSQLENMREQLFFLQYAYQLMETAYKKGCPLKPFIRTVSQFKTQNRIGAEIHVPPHLLTTLSFGRRSQGDSRANEQKSNRKQQQSQPTEEQQLQDSIIKNLRKIEELVLTETKSKLKKRNPNNA